MLKTIQIKADSIEEFLYILQEDMKIWLGIVTEINIKNEVPDNCYGTVSYESSE